MKRYFYTDPLAAAWMAKHFGVQIEGLEYRAPSADKAGSKWTKINDFYVPGKFNIHPDSINLLDPRPGDVCKYFDIGKVWYGPWDNLHSGDAQGAVVIQRDGTAFMWPESEEI